MKNFGKGSFCVVPSHQVSTITCLYSWCLYALQNLYDPMFLQLHIVHMIDSIVFCHYGQHTYAVHATCFSILLFLKLFVLLIGNHVSNNLCYLLTKMTWKDFWNKVLLRLNQTKIFYTKIKECTRLFNFYIQSKKNMLIECMSWIYQSSE